MNKRNIIGFYELDKKWQKEAKRNLDEFAEETMYLKPLSRHTPEKYILWDLSECMKYEGEHEGFKYNAVINISNNSAMLLDIDDTFETAKIKIV